MKYIRVDEVTATPWRNGGGVTRELWRWPEGGVDWRVRISVADIAQDGLFSSFPGVDRWFTVLVGKGVVLGFAEGAQVLGPDNAPLLFDGAAAPHCRLRAGPTRDLNFMVARDAGLGTMAPVQADQPWCCSADLRAVFTIDPLTLQIDAADFLHLPAWTLAVQDAAAGQVWRAAGSEARAWWLSFKPEGAMQL
jgi:uncharacterized protein